MERNGLRVNVHKTKGLQLLFGMESSVSKVDPCGVCDEQVVCNSIQCTKCQTQVYHRCSVVPRITWSVEYVLVIIIEERRSWFKRDEDVLKKVEKFCYLGDMARCYGGAPEAVSKRIATAWKKFRELRVNCKNIDIKISKKNAKIKSPNFWQLL